MKETEPSPSGDGSFCFQGREQPLFLFEVRQQRRHDGRAHQDHCRIAVFPAEFRHVGEVHAVPACQQGQGQEHRRHHGEDLHQVVLLDGQLGLICLPQLGHRLPQGLNGVQIPLHPVAQIGKAPDALLVQQAVVVVRQVVKDGVQLLVIALQPQQLLPPGDDPVQIRLVSSGEHLCLSVADGCLQLVQVGHVPLQQTDEEMVEGLAVGQVFLLRHLQDCPGSGFRRIVLTEDEQILPVQIHQHLRSRCPPAPYVVPVKGNEVKALKALKCLDLPLMDVVQHLGIHIGLHLPDTGDGQYHPHKRIFLRFLRVLPGRRPWAAGPHSAWRISRVPPGTR